MMLFLNPKTIQIGREKQKNCNPLDYPLYTGPDVPRRPQHFCTQLHIFEKVLEAIQLRTSQSRPEKKKKRKDRDI